MKTAYEVEVRFIGDPDYYYFENRKEAEEAADKLNTQPPENAYFGQVRTRATMREIKLRPNEYIEGTEIITELRRDDAWTH